MTSGNELPTVLLVTNIPTPYRIPLFNELDRQLKEKGMRLKVIFGAAGYPRRKWQIDMMDCRFSFQILRSRKITLFSQEKVIFTYPGLFRLIRRERPALIITNGFSLASTKLWLRSFFRKHPPYLIWSGAIERVGRPENRLRRILRRALMGRAAGYLAYGTLAKKYFLAMGAIEEKITIAYNTVDTDFFVRETARLRDVCNPAGIKHLLYIGDLSTRKNVIKLLKVIEGLQEVRRDFVLDLVGDGPERENLKLYTIKNGLTDLIHFHGIKQKQELPLFLAQTDCFLFQTDFDIWGLVLVEAMAAGLPCLASIYAGASADLIQDAVSGFSVDFADSEKAAEKIEWILNNPEPARVMGRKAQEFIETKLNLITSAEGFVRSVLDARASGHIRMNRDNDDAQ